MASTLSRRDINILEKIKDPESDPSMAVLLDDRLPKDPNMKNQEVYDRVNRTEREVVLTMQRLDMEMASQRHQSKMGFVQEYRNCVLALDEIISTNPTYASARNNRAQALRRLFGDTMLIGDIPDSTGGLIQDAKLEERTLVSKTVLDDLDKAISLLSPASIFAAMSPFAAKTLSLAHTQRAAIYHTTSKLLATGSLWIESTRKETSWTAVEFEAAAARDFASGARYGNEIAKGLAVSSNPTAKLCGQMVQEMMRKEYRPDLP